MNVSWWRVLAEVVRALGLVALAAGTIIALAACDPATSDQPGPEPVVETWENVDE